MTRVGGVALAVWAVRGGRASCWFSGVATRGDGIKQYLRVSRSVLKFLVFTFFAKIKMQPPIGFLCFSASAMEEDRVKYAQLLETPAGSKNDSAELPDRHGH